MTRETLSRHNPYIRYLAPFCVFLLASAAQGAASSPEMFWLLYAIKIVATLLAIFYCFKGYRQEIAGRFDPWAVVVGVAVLIPWIINYHAWPAPADIGAAAFDPAAVPAVLAPAILIKLIASSLVIPVIEELTFRSFLMRVFIKNDFLSVPLGSYTALSFWATVAAFAAMHPAWQWDVAALAGIAYGAYLVKTKNLVGCMIAHGTTNLGLGLYVIITGTWELWV